MRYTHIPARERALWLKFKLRGDPAARLAIYELHLPLVLWIYGRIAKRALPHDREDALQAGRVALLLAIDRYDIEQHTRRRKARPVTYLTSWIDGKIRNFIARGDRSRHQVDGESVTELITDFRHLTDCLLGPDPSGGLLDEAAFAAFKNVAATRLTDLQYDAFVYWYLEHLPYRELERKFHLTAPQVREMMRTVRGVLQDAARETGLAEAC